MNPMKSIFYLTLIIYGFTSIPLVAYVYYLFGRAFIHICSVLSSTYSFIIYGDYTSQLSYFNAQDKISEIVKDIIWFPDLPLEGINKIGAFLQYSFFSRNDAFNVFIYSFGAVIISLILSVIIELNEDSKTDQRAIEYSVCFWIGMGISGLCFYPSYTLVISTPLFALTEMF